jgi:hypothetical protein
MPELAWFALAVVVILAIGVAVGMLVAAVLTRWSEREDADDDEEPGAGRS